MMTTTRPPLAMKTLERLFALGIGATLIAAVAGVWLWLAEPADGTTLNDGLGLIVATSGLAAGLFFAGAAIWAQFRNLWEYVPMWLRVAVILILVAGAVIAGVRS